MVIYEFYRIFVKEGTNELFEYFIFVFVSILCFPIDILLSPIELIAFILYKLNRRGKNEC